MTVEVNGWTKHDENDDDVSDASRRCFGLPLADTCPHFDQQCPIGNEKEDEASSCCKATVDKHSKFQTVGVGASQPDYLSDITEIAVQVIGTTKREWEDDNDLDHGMDESSSPCSHHQSPTNWFGDYSNIMQWVADSHIPIKCHGNKEIDLSST